MLKEVRIRNFRSIHAVDVPIGRLSAFIGPNNSGKSNILLAMNHVLGAVYPSIRTFDDSDFYRHDKSKPIEIEARFQEALNSDKRVWGFRLTYDGSDLEYLTIGEEGEVLTYYTGGREIRVSNVMKDEVSLMFLPIDRQAYQQVKATQWTVYGKLLRHISSGITQETKKAFKTGADDHFKQHLGEHIKAVEKKLDQYVQAQTGLNLQLRMSALDVADILKNLRPHISDLGDPSFFISDIENEGAGVQSAVAVAIARTYAEIVKQPLILALEEPELYLHPHACRHFYRILKDLSENGVQVIYTTHERSFVAVADFASVNIVRKENGQTRIWPGSKIPTNPDPIRTASRLCEELNEIFFAEKVVLVEGPEDRIACKMSLEKAGIELDKRNISVVDCGGIGGLKPLAEILKGFDTQVIGVVDEDPGKPLTAKKVIELKSLIGDGNVFVQTPNLEGLFGQSKTFSKEAVLKFIPEYLDSNPIPEIYQQIAARLST